MNLKGLTKRRVTPRDRSFQLAVSATNLIEDGFNRIGEMQDALNMRTVFEKNRLDRALQMARKRGWIRFNVSTKTWASTEKRWEHDVHA